jgi:anti-sigma B factor antagonist
LDTAQLTTGTEEGSRLLSVTGELDMSASPRLEIALAENLVPGTPLVLDLSGVEFLDSLGLRVLLAANTRAAAQGSALLIVPSGQVTRVFSLVGIDERIFALYPDRAQAVRAAASAG